MSAFFQFFSKTDRNVVSYCSRPAQISQTSMGAMVLLSGVFAIISGACAIYITFHSIVAAATVALLYGLLIVALDRELVSFPQKTAVVPKLLFAVFIGTVISAPLELKVFESRINDELALTRVNETKAILERQGQANGVYDAKINTLQRDIRDYRDGIMRSLSTMEAETVGRQVAGRTGRAGRGPVYVEAEKLKNNYQSLLDQSEMQLMEMQAARDQEFSNAKKEASVRSQSAADDLLSRREALGKIQASSRNGLYTVWGVRLLFVLIQVLPMMLYLLMPANDYMAIVEAERRKAVARVHAIANAHLAEITNNPYSTPLPKIHLAFSSVKGNGENSMGGEQTMMA